MPAEIEANKLAFEDPTMRTVEVEQFCSWSAWRMKSTSNALRITSSVSYCSIGVVNIMCRKLER